MKSECLEWIKAHPRDARVMGLWGMAQVLHRQSWFYPLAIPVFVLVVFFKLVLFVSGGIGHIVGFGLYGLNQPSFDKYQQQRWAVGVAEHQRACGNFGAAIKALNEALREKPDFPDALFWKAQVLLEGFENPLAARRYFKKVMCGQ